MHIAFAELSAAGNDDIGEVRSDSRRQALFDGYSGDEFLYGLRLMAATLPFLQRIARRAGACDDRQAALRRGRA